MKTPFARDCEAPVSELEILRRRRELVILSAKLQRTTIVRRLDNVSRHPLQAVVGLLATVAGSAASIPLLFKVGTLVFNMLGRKRDEARRTVKHGRATLFSKVLQYLRLLPIQKMFPAKFLNR